MADLGRFAREISIPLTKIHIFLGGIHKSLKEICKSAGEISNPLFSTTQPKQISRDWAKVRLGEALDCLRDTPQEYL